MDIDQGKSAEGKPHRRLTGHRAGARMTVDTNQLNGPSFEERPAGVYGVMNS